MNYGTAVYAAKTHYRPVYYYGRDILASELFKAAYQQPHHRRVSVADHSIRVAKIASVIGIGCNMEVLIRASLFHDLGIIGLDMNKMDCAKYHPQKSAVIARNVFKESEAVVSAVETHMWPMTLKLPKSREGFVLTIADKIAALIDFSKQQ